MKVVLISAGIVLVALGISFFAAPIAVDGIPMMWSAVLAWMKPPYLYIIVNGIILTIAVSSRFHRRQLDTPPPSAREELISDQNPTQSSFETFSAHQQFIEGSRVVDEMAEDEIVASVVGDAVAEFHPPVVNNILIEREAIVETEADCAFVDSMLNNSTEDRISPELQPESVMPATEKPLVSSRFGHRKPIRNNPEGTNTKALRVARQRKQETLESTWKMITEGSGRHMPLTRQKYQKKPDACESHSHVNESTARIRKEASPSQDELNRRVEAFIKKFNEEMRTQRQESLNQYMEMMNRGI